MTAMESSQMVDCDGHTNMSRSWSVNGPPTIDTGKAARYRGRAESFNHKSVMSSRNSFPAHRLFLAANLALLLMPRLLSAQVDSAGGNNNSLQIRFVDSATGYAVQPAMVVTRSALSDRSGERLNQSAISAAGRATLSLKPGAHTITVAALTLEGSFPADMSLSVELTNNARDDAPVWENCTRFPIGEYPAAPA